MNETSSGYSKGKGEAPVWDQAQALRAGGKAPVRAALLDARQRTLELADAFAAALGAAGMLVPYAPELNPPLWEWGHVAWFQEYWVTRNRQRSLGIACDPEHARALSLLSDADLWYDSRRVAHRSRWELPLPDARSVRQYLMATLEQTLAALDSMPADATDQELYFFRLVALHEAMHAEAAVYMGQRLGVPLAIPGVAETPNAVARMLVPAQLFRLGASAAGFSFDNELGGHDVVLAAFEIDAAPVTWAAYFGFVDAGGYDQRQWWTDAGWDWLRVHGQRGPCAAQRGLASAPAVHLSAHEAQAWCRWAGRRLPTEIEWECAALQAPGFAWGSVWEWTASSFQPYPGFEPHPYREYSAPWFGARVVLRGACAATSAWLAHPRYRNFFEPDRTDIFAGFRSCA